MRWLAIVALGAFIGGCTAPKPPPRIEDRDPSVKIPAMRLAAQREDQSKIPLLIDQLDSEDPAVRFYAIEALQHLTNQDLGYLYYQDEVRRRPAIDRWRAWLADHPMKPDDGH